MKNNNSGINFAKELIQEVDEKIKRVYWTNQEIEKYFARRNYQEIIDQKNTGFMNPCSDLTLVTSNLLSQERIPHQWVLQQENPTEEFNFPRIHFALKFMYNNKPHIINYIRNNNVNISQGNSALENNSNITQRLLIPINKLDLSKSVYENLIQSDFSKHLNGFSLEIVLKRLKKDNSPENFEKFKKYYGESFKIKEL